MKKKEVIEAKIVEDKTTTEVEEEKVYFLPRLIAYILDIIIVGVVSSFILMLIPVDKNYDKYMEEYKTMQADCIKDMEKDNSITAFDCLYRTKDVTYDLNKTRIPYDLITIVVYIGYFIVFQAYNKGQTLGKKMMKIKVVDTKTGNNKLTINQVAIRALIIDSIGINLLMIGALLFSGREYYFYAYLAFQALSALIIIVTLLMIFIRKDGKGLHDVAAGTKVVTCE